MLIKLAFIYFALSSMLTTVTPAPLRLRRSTETPALTATPLALKPQKNNFDFDLASTLSLPSSTLATLDVVPANCAIYNSVDGECPTFFTASNVTYDDCGDAFTICQCSTASMSVASAVERLGRVPVGLRRYIATVALLPSETTRAYTLTSGDIHMFGDTQMDTWVHEAGHAYDYASGSPISGSREWLKAIESDNCVPDTYSATSAGEDFAQHTVMKIYSLTHNNTLPEGMTADCMSRQIEFMNSLPVFNNDALFGNTCAIEGSDPGARHVSPPPLLNSTRVFPVPPAPTNTPDGTFDSSAAGPAATPPRKDNAGSSAFLQHSDVTAIMGMFLAAWFSW